MPLRTNQPSTKCCLIPNFPPPDNSTAKAVIPLTLNKYYTFSQNRMKLSEKRSDIINIEILPGGKIYLIGYLGIWVSNGAKGHVSRKKINFI